LPTFVREYEKVAAEAAREGLDHVRFLLRLAELELIDRERRMVERRIRGGEKLRHVRLHRHSIAQQAADTRNSRAANISSPATMLLLWVIPARERRMSVWR
jgi:hypothetical protein